MGVRVRNTPQVPSGPGALIEKYYTIENLKVIFEANLAIRNLRIFDLNP